MDLFLSNEALILNGDITLEGLNTLDIIKENNYATEAEIEAIDQRVADLVAECEKFAEESPFPEAQQLYDVVYEQENYPFIPHKL